MATPDRGKALDTALAQIERQFGKGSVMRLGDEARVPIEVIPTGSIALDVALGIGGLPRGRVVEIYGPESSGKTTVALHAVANAQRAGGIAAFIDAEHALDPDYAQRLGVDTDGLLVSQPDTGEQALEIADMLIRSGALDIIVIDSVAALVPRAEIEGEMGDSHVGLQARLMSQALRKLSGALSSSGTTADHRADTSTVARYGSGRGRRRAAPGRSRPRRKEVIESAAMIARSRRGPRRARRPAQARPASMGRPPSGPGEASAARPRRSSGAPGGSSLRST
jgi:hypothetical protein